MDTEFVTGCAFVYFLTYVITENVMMYISLLKSLHISRQLNTLKHLKAYANTKAFKCIRSKYTKLNQMLHQILICRFAKLFLVLCTNICKK